MFRKTENSVAVVTKPAGKPVSKKDSIPTIIGKDVNILGNIVSEGNVDFNGTLDGNIRCETLTLREDSSIKGEVVANSVLAYGKIRGLIRAKIVQLFSSSNIEGVIMHEAITIEDGAFVDAKFKRTDKVRTKEESEFSFDDNNDTVQSKVLDNLRLIAG